MSSIFCRPQNQAIFLCEGHALSSTHALDNKKKTCSSKSLGNEGSNCDWKWRAREQLTASQRKERDRVCSSSRELLTLFRDQTNVKNHIIMSERTALYIQESESQGKSDVAKEKECYCTVIGCPQESHQVSACCDLLSAYTVCGRWTELADQNPNMEELRISLLSKCEEAVALLLSKWRNTLTLVSMECVPETRKVLPADGLPALRELTCHSLDAETSEILFSKSVNLRSIRCNIVVRRSVIVRWQDVPPGVHVLCPGYCSLADEVDMSQPVPHLTTLLSECQSLTAFATDKEETWSKALHRSGFDSWRRAARDGSLTEFRMRTIADSDVHDMLLHTKDSLIHLRLGNASITDNGLMQLQKATKLQVLVIGMRRLGHQRLTLNGMKKFTKQSFTKESRMQRLEVYEQVRVPDDEQKLLVQMETELSVAVFSLHHLCGTWSMLTSSHGDVQVDGLMFRRVDGLLADERPILPRITSAVPMTVCPVHKKEPAKSPSSDKFHEPDPVYEEISHKAGCRGKCDPVPEKENAPPVPLTPRPSRRPDEKLGEKPVPEAEAPTNSTEGENPDSEQESKPGKETPADEDLEQAFRPASEQLAPAPASSPQPAAPHKSANAEGKPVGNQEAEHPVPAKSIGKPLPHKTHESSPSESQAAAIPPPRPGRPLPPLPREEPVASVDEDQYLEPKHEYDEVPHRPAAGPDKEKSEPGKGGEPESSGSSSGSSDSSPSSAAPDGSRSESPAESIATNPVRKPKSEASTDSSPSSESAPESVPVPVSVPHRDSGPQHTPHHDDHPHPHHEKGEAERDGEQKPEQPVDNGPHHVPVSPRPHEHGHDDKEGVRDKSGPPLHVHDEMCVPAAFQPPDPSSPTSDTESNDTPSETSEAAVSPPHVEPQSGKRPDSPSNSSGPPDASIETPPAVGPDQYRPLDREEVSQSPEKERDEQESSVSVSVHAPVTNFITFPHPHHPKESSSGGPEKEETSEPVPLVVLPDRGQQAEDKTPGHRLRQLILFLPRLVCRCRCHKHQ